MSVFDAINIVPVKLSVQTINPSLLTTHDVIVMMKVLCEDEWFQNEINHCKLLCWAPRQDEQFLRLLFGDKLNKLPKLHLWMEFSPDRIGDTVSHSRLEIQVVSTHETYIIFIVEYGFNILTYHRKHYGMVQSDK